MKEEVIQDIAELIQDYMAWVEANPYEAAKLAAIYEPTGEPGLMRGRVSDLLGFSKWLARGAATPTSSPAGEQKETA